jgi:hypothetical protein
VNEIYLALYKWLRNIFWKPRMHVCWSSIVISFSGDNKRFSMSHFKAWSLRGGATPVSLYPITSVLVPWAGPLGSEAHSPPW